MKDLLKTSARRIFLLTLQCLWFLAIAIPIMMTFERAPVTKWTKRDVLNPNSTVPPGEDLKIRIEATINKECPGTVIRQIIDSKDRLFTFAEEPRQELDAYTVELNVPLGATAGPAKYTARIRWRCNWVQEWWPKEIRQAPLDFIIAPSEGQVPDPAQQGLYSDPENLDDVVLNGALQYTED